MSGYLQDQLLELIIERVGIYLTGEEVQLLTDAILELLDEWFSTDIYA